MKFLIYCQYTNNPHTLSSDADWILLILLIYIFTNPSARAGYDTRSIFKWSITDLNSEFSFSQASCLTKAEEPSLPYYLPIAGYYWYITTKSIKNQNARRKGNLQILGNIGSGHYQTSGDKRNKSKKNIPGERENYSKLNYIAEISSKGKTHGLSPL